MKKSQMKTKFFYSDYQVAVSGSSNTSGALELTFLNISGRICADGWDDADATVACRELGYMKGTENYCLMCVVLGA